MEKVRLGRTNLRVAKMGWGGIPIQRVEEKEAVSVVREVVKLGVNLLDTARGYTTSEYRIGLALQKIDRPIILSSKSMVRTAEIYADVQESLKQLQVKRIHIYNLHNVSSFEDYKKVMAVGGAFEGLQRAQAEGLIGHIGFTGHNLDVLQKVLEEDQFEVIMVCYSFLEPAAEQKLFPLARAKDVGVLAMKPFSGGVIEDADLALRFVLSTPDIVAIPGSETLERARENWKIFAAGTPLSQEDWARIKKIQLEFDRQFCHRCDYCQPCSAKIDIQLMMGLKTVFNALGPKMKETEWVKKAVQNARECTECEECLPRCPYQLPIPQLIKENLAWYDRC